MAGFFVEYIILKLFAGLWIELTRCIALMQVCVSAYANARAQQKLASCPSAPSPPRIFRCGRSVGTAVLQYILSDATARN